MVDQLKELVLFLRLAQAFKNRLQMSDRDRALVLAGTYTAMLQMHPVAEFCRALILQNNHGHMLRKWPTFADAIVEPDFGRFSNRSVDDFPPSGQKPSWPNWITSAMSKKPTIRTSMTILLRSWASIDNGFPRILDNSIDEQEVQSPYATGRDIRQRGPARQERSLQAAELINESIAFAGRDLAESPCQGRFKLEPIYQ